SRELFRQFVPKKPTSSSSSDAE
ncbi:hypothetical protein, partial [Atlantibacter subterraneus]